MKIALVSPYDYPYPGGVTSHIAHLKDNISRMGHDVKVIAPSSSDKNELAKDNVLVVGKPTPVPSSGSIARITLSLRLSGPIKRILNEESFDIIHLHEPLVPGVPIAVLRFSQSINIGTFHAYAGSNIGYLYGRRILKRWFRKLQGKIAVSRAAMEFVSQYFPGYYNIIPNGIDYERFAADVPPIEVFDDGKLNILFVGRPEKRKGLKYLLRAFVYVKREFPDSRLIVVGPKGGLHEGYEKWARKSGLADVVFTGFVSNDDLPRYYKTADVFCSPATGQESFGIVLLEAMAAGKPIIASNIEGYAGVMTHGIEGFMVRPKNSDALAMSLIHVLANESLRTAMGNAGSIKARDYSWDRVARRVVAYYQRLLDESQPSNSIVQPFFATAES
ncbi:MAG: glycosyltransferase family 4 protein [Chloroflexi bacterium]|nr:glycosyltransferase family 4 protein [Chloroflexota bacterium]